MEPETFQVGDKVVGLPFGPEDENRIRGIVIGHGIIGGQLMVLVDVGDSGGYISNDCIHIWVHCIVVHPGGIEKV